VKPLPEGWLEIEVPTRLVAAMLCGASFGLAVSDEKGQTMWNNDIHSREQAQFAPYLVVEGVPGGGGAPPQVADLQARADSGKATLLTGAIRLAFTVPKGRFSFAYRLEARGGEFAGWTAVPRCLIPFAGKPGSRQSIRVPDLRPETRYELRLTVMDEAGSESQPAFAPALSSPAKRKPEVMPKVSPLPPFRLCHPQHNRMQEFSKEREEVNIPVTVTAEALQRVRRVSVRVGTLGNAPGDKITLMLDGQSYPLRGGACFQEISLRKPLRAGNAMLHFRLDHREGAHRVRVSCATVVVEKGK